MKYKLQTEPMMYYFYIPLQYQQFKGAMHFMVLTILLKEVSIAFILLIAFAMIDASAEISYNVDVNYSF